MDLGGQFLDKLFDRKAS